MNAKRIAIQGIRVRRYRELEERWHACQRCAGCHRPDKDEQPVTQTRSQVVHLRGTVPCDVLFIGEAPGRSEDATGYPFIGPAGKLLDPHVSSHRDDSQTLLGQVWAELGFEFTYAITNVICCLPLNITNSLRQPNKAEAEQCSEHLRDVLSLCQPKLIVYLGQVASKLATPTVRQWCEPMMPKDPCPQLSIYHPAYLLRQGADNSNAFNRTFFLLTDFLQTHEHLIR